MSIISLVCCGASSAVDRSNRTVRSDKVLNPSVIYVVLVVFSAGWVFRVACFSRCWLLMVKGLGARVSHNKARRPGNKCYRFIYRFTGHGLREIMYHSLEKM